jgi:hypothetical protein
MQAWCLGIEKQVNAFPTPQLRGRQQVVIALSVPYNPPCSGRVWESKLSHEDAGRLVLSGLPIYLTLSSSSNHICCMIISCSLHGYIRTCLPHLGIYYFILCFTFILEVSPDVCPLSMKYHFYPYYELWSTMQVCNHGHIYSWICISCSPLEKYK